VGLLLAITGLTQVITQTAMLGPAIRRFGETRDMAAATVIRTLSLGLYAIATMVWVAGIGSALFAMSALSLVPALALVRYYGRQRDTTTV
jgi:hypothetical protein